MKRGKESRKLKTLLDGLQTVYPGRDAPLLASHLHANETLSENKVISNSLRKFRLAKETIAMTLSRNSRFFYDVAT